MCGFFLSCFNAGYRGKANHDQHSSSSQQAGVQKFPAVCQEHETSKLFTEDIEQPKPNDITACEGREPDVDSAVLGGHQISVTEKMCAASGKQLRQNDFNHSTQAQKSSCSPCNGTTACEPLIGKEERFLMDGVLDLNQDGPHTNPTGLPSIFLPESNDISAPLRGPKFTSVKYLLNLERYQCTSDINIVFNEGLQLLDADTFSALDTAALDNELTDMGMLGRDNLVLKSDRLPEALQRHGRWSLEDFKLVKHVHSGHTSDVVEVSSVCYGVARLTHVNTRNDNTPIASELIGSGGVLVPTLVSNFALHALACLHRKLHGHGELCCKMHMLSSVWPMLISCRVYARGQAIMWQ